jgi:DNA invertase Pin-like site-specific DNA recombinase
MGSKRKRLDELNMEKRKEVLDLIGKVVSQRKTAVQFGAATSTVGNIKQKQGPILKDWEENCSNGRKRKLRRTDNENGNAVTLQRFLKWRE